MARPLKPIDADLVAKLAMIGCTTSEIAAIVDASKDTLERRFAALIEKGRESGKSSLRRMQWKSAEAGNATMQIWLGKQLLGQRDHTAHSLDGVPAGSSFKVEVVHFADAK